MQLIGLLGLAGSGKGTAGDHLTNKHGFIQDSFAKTLKDVLALMFDWDRKLLEGDTKESREWREQNDAWWASKLKLQTFTPRMAMTMVGTDTIRHHFNNDMWKLVLERRLERYSTADTAVVITDCRFPNEIELIRSFGGKLAYITNGSEPKWFEQTADYIYDKGFNDGSISHALNNFVGKQHISEWAWSHFTRDNDTIRIVNDSSLEHLYSQVNKLVL